MISSTQVSIVLIIIWGFVYYRLKKKLVTAKGYFLLLLIMGSAGLVLPMDEYIHYYSTRYGLFNTVVFAFLLIFTIIPWFYFDKHFKNWGVLKIKSSSIPFLRTLFILNIILGIYAIIYSIPYAIMALNMGANDVRQYINDDTFYPRSIWTTICVGIGYLSPLQILCYYLSLLDTRLKKFSTPLFIVSLSYLITMLPYASRDGFIFIPLTYLFLFKVFNRSLSDKSKKNIKRVTFIFGSIVLGIFLLITIQRFWDNIKGGRSSFESFIYGTWGYFFQQPYVFDQHIQYLTEFVGFSRRFELLEIIFGTPHHSFTPELLTTSFGTMYAEFYAVSGWKSLIYISLFYYISFSLLFKILFTKRNYFGILIVFSVYLYYTITGLFYYKMFLLSVTELYLFVLFGCLFINNVLYLDNKK